MKYVLIILLVIILGMLGYGFYVKNSPDGYGEIIIGIGVLMIAFIFMPLFIYHRYKNKDIKSFTFDNFRKNLENHKE